MRTNYGDEQSKRIFTLQLEKKGYKVWDADADLENQYKFRPDLYAEKDGVQWAFELKARLIPSTKYGDILISAPKVDLYAEHPEVQYRLVFFYTDGVGYMIEPSQPHTISMMPAKKTTFFDDQTLIMKPQAIYHPSTANRFTFNPKIIYG